MGTIYASLDQMLSSTTDTSVGFTQRTSVSPYFVDSVFIEAYRQRHEVLREFMLVVLELFDAALANEVEPFILKILLNEVPRGLGAGYHRWLKSAHKRPPVFFRTDEAAPGKILEIQCPGSLWGDHELLSDYFVATGVVMPSLSGEFAQALESYLGRQPVVHHLLDNASIPHTMRYFLHKTRPQVIYYGVDADVRSSDCNFVRSHSFVGLMAENWAKDRLQRCIDGEVYYDLPPMVLFDQKIVLALPFLSETRRFFPDRVREILAFTQLLRPEGILQEDGSWMTIDELASTSRGKRNFFLKYGGCDVSLNWGSQTVYDLDSHGKESCLATLQEMLSGFDSGRIWLLQRTETMKEPVDWIERDSSQSSKELHAKFSGFYGPTGFLAACVQHRDFPKVHGGTETVFNVCVEKRRDTV